MMAGMSPPPLPHLEEAEQEAGRAPERHDPKVAPLEAAASGRGIPGGEEGLEEEVMILDLRSQI